VVIDFALPLQLVYHFILSKLVDGLPLEYDLLNVSIVLIIISLELLALISR